MKSTLPLLLLAGLLASGPLYAQNLARVNGIAIPSERADVMIKELVAQGRPDTPQLRDLVKDRLVTYELMMQEAGKLGLAKQPDVAIQLDFARQNVLVRAFLQDYVKKNPVTDAEIKAEYDRIKDEPHPVAKEYLAHHILVKTEAEAKNVLVKLKGGAKFEVLAKQVSIDTSNKDQGGELAWAAPDAYVPEFGQALMALQKGQVSDKPVQTQYGWHVIRVDDVRDVAPPTLEQLRPQIQEALQSRHVEKMLADLRSGAKID
jgi:peptidyl-prolyl cis-trans isomerase C